MPDGRPPHWQAGVVGVATAKPASARLSDADVTAALVAATAAWNDLPGLRHAGLLLQVSAQPDAGPSAIMVRFCRGRWTHAAGLLAHTSFEAAPDTGVVTSARVEVNECDYAFAGPDELAAGTFDLQAVLVHELGHALGLAHSADPSAVMFTSTGQTRQRQPTDDDDQAVRKIYGAPSPTSSGALVSTPAALGRGPLLPQFTPMLRLDGANDSGSDGTTLYTAEPVVLPALERAPAQAKARRRRNRAPTEVRPSGETGRTR